jgi:hypothetical protein
MFLENLQILKKHLAVFYMILMICFGNKFFLFGLYSQIIKKIDYNIYIYNQFVNKSLFRLTNLNGSGPPIRPGTRKALA